MPEKPCPQNPLLDPHSQNPHRFPHQINRARHYHDGVRASAVAASLQSRLHLGHRSQSRLPCGSQPAEFLPATPTSDSPAAWQSPAPPAETGSPSSLRLPCRASLRKQKSADGRHSAPKGRSAGPTLPPDYAPHRAQSPATRPALRSPETVPASASREFRAQSTRP